MGIGRSAFLTGRNVFVGPLIVNEILYWTEGLSSFEKAQIIREKKE